MKFHTDQMDEHKRKLNLRRLRQNARDTKRGELIANAKRLPGSDRVKQATLAAALMRSVR